MTRGPAFRTAGIFFCQAITTEIFIAHRTTIDCQRESKSSSEYSKSNCDDNKPELIPSRLKFCEKSNGIASKNPCRSGLEEIIADPVTPAHFLNDSSGINNSTGICNCIFLHLSFACYVGLALNLTTATY